ncbi:MAG: prepilin-type N-terminal cleavage/methylation domain-containing protein [Polyangiaceae bacterium]|nr:prepilin-type N-terminal cleavage/methylation domain-containing protein [Polyangiaceae bacterium]
MPCRRRAASPGFTLLEVLVAIAILGLSVTAVISAQFTPVKEANHARYLALSTGLARCKMTEIEIALAKDGFSEMDDHASGACCEGQEANDIGCEWSIEKPELPDPALGKLDLDSDLDLGALGVLNKSSQGEVSLPPDAGVHDVTQLLAGAGDDPAAAAASAGAGIASMVMGMVYPDLKLLLEASVRRVTVKLTWTETGGGTYGFELVQWVVNPSQAGAIVAAAAEAAAADAMLDPGGGKDGGR